MKALILAAGYGTRLYPLTKKYPKPLLPIAKRPILDYVAEKIIRAKCLAEIIVITNDRFYQNFLDWVKKFTSANKGLRIKVLNDGTRCEKSRLGAIGDINFALTREGIREDVLVFGGDNLFKEGLSGFVEFAVRHRPRATIGVYDIRETKQAGRYGVVRLDADNKIIGFNEKPLKPQSSLIATCLYYIPEEKLSYFQEYLQDPRNEKDSSGSFIGWLSKREEVYGFVFKKYWCDIGDPQIYQEADKVFSDFRKEKGDGKV